MHKHTVGDDLFPPRITLRCRVCRKKFSGPYTSALENNVLGHIELKHPEEALSYASEYAELASQADAEYKRLGLE